MTLSSLQKRKSVAILFKMTLSISQKRRNVYRLKKLFIINKRKATYANWLLFAALDVVKLISYRVRKVGFCKNSLERMERENL